MDDDKLEEVHEDLLTWAEIIGVEINGIRPMRLSGRGFGIVATDHIPEGTEVLTVPCAALRTRETVPPTIAKKLPKDMTAHGLIAADSALNQSQNTANYAPWEAVVPSWDDIQASLPLTWPRSLQALLPAAARQLLDKQRKKFDKDWASVSAAFPFPARNGIRSSCTQDEYLYAWLLVNTRCFYYTTPQTERLPKEDHMALQPVADLFNHTDAGGCRVSYHHSDSYSFRTWRAHEKGEEVHISYGSHNNDFLLVEYGFVLAQNAWDEVCLDEAVLPSLSVAQQEELEDVGFLGNYVVDKDTVCHRTQVAVRLLLTNAYLGMEEWRRFVKGLDDGEKSQRRVDRALAPLLERYASDEIEDRIEELKGLQFESSLDESRRNMLLRRWEQIAALISGTVDRLKSS